MFCAKCGTAVEDSYQNCPNCGASLPQNSPAVPALPQENAPLSAWSYFWLRILFAIPVVGFIFLIIFSINNGNINRRNFARSYWCGLVILLIIALVYLIIFFILAALGTATVGGISGGF